MFVTGVQTVLFRSGIGDGWSWLRGGQPLLFDNNLDPKPCYYSVLEVLKKGKAAQKK